MVMSIFLDDLIIISQGVKQGHPTLNSSGAAQGGEPQNVLRCWSMLLTWVAKPKSPTLTTGYVTSSRLLFLMVTWWHRIRYYKAHSTIAGSVKEFELELGLVP